MKMNMDQWTKELLEAPVKKALPVLSFPSIQLMGITVKELINDSDLQAKGMKAVADRTPNSGGAVSLMDLSVEAECFGAPIRVADDEVPTVVGPVLDTEIDEDERMEAAEAWKYRKSAPAARRFTLMPLRRRWISSPTVRYLQALSARSRWLAV